MAFKLERNSVMAFMATVVLVTAGVVDARPNCATLIISLTPCLSFVTNGAVKPPPACCTAFASVVKKNTTCLCQIINGGSGVTVNRTRALELPHDCHVATPPISKCHTAVVQVSALSTSSNIVPPTTNGGSSNAGTLFAPSLVTIILIMGVVLMKTFS